MSSGARRKVANRPPAGIDKAAENGIARLEATAKEGDERAFVDAYRAIRWETRSADEHAHAARMALQLGIYEIARDLAAAGTRRFPDHPALEQMARVLAPDGHARAAGPADPSVAANRDWLAAHSAEYLGQWVAIKGGRLLGAAPTVQRLTEQVPDWREATVTKIAW